MHKIFRRYYGMGPKLDTLLGQDRIKISCSLEAVPYVLALYIRLEKAALSLVGDG